MLLTSVQLPNWPRIRRVAILLSFVCIFIYFLNVRDKYDIFTHNSEIHEFSHTRAEYVDEKTTYPTEATTADLVSDIPTLPEVRQIKVSVFSPSNLATLFTTINYPNSSKYEVNSEEYKLSTNSQLHYHNTFSMLGRLVPRINSIIFTDQPEVVELALSAGNNILPITKTNVFGMPVLSQMFIQAMEYSSSFFYGFTNGDMLYPRYDLIRNLDIIKGLIEQGELDGNVLIIGSRRNVLYLSEYIVQSDEDIYGLAEKGELHRPDAQDFLFVTRTSFDWHIVPDFVVGRPAYDNWLVDFAYHRDYTVIDLTQTLVVIHQTGADGTTASHWSAHGLDKKWNYQLARGRLDHGTIEFAQFVSGFREYKRGDTRARYWTLTHKQRPHFYFEIEY